jgi:hypothetical protein
MVDQSIQFPEGIVKDVLVQIQDHYVLTDFMVLDMGAKDKETPIILGRPFLNTTNAIIFIRSGQVHFQFLDGKVGCHFNSYTTHEQPKKPRNRRRRQSRRQANQLLMDGWTDYLGEVMRYEDYWNEWDIKDKKIEEPTKDEATPPKSVHKPIRYEKRR